MTAIQQFYNDDQLVENDFGFENNPEPKQGIVIINLRQKKDFDEVNLGGSKKVPFVWADQPDPYGVESETQKMFRRLEDWAAGPEKDLVSSKEKRILFLCLDGHSSCMATSVFQHKEYLMFIIKGGFQALRKPRGEQLVSTAQKADQQEQWFKLVDDP